MANTKNTQEARFRIIEILLRWEGQVDNQRLRSILGVQAVQASRILADYAARNPTCIRRQSPRAPYEASGVLKPMFSSGSIEEYLTLPGQSEVLGDLIEDARPDFSELSPQVFSTLSHACRRRVGALISYRSMTTPGGKQRLIYPHTIVRAGRRWHVRAWCDERKDYRDFVVGRIRSASISAESKPEVREQDVDWNSKVPLVIGAHPELSIAQARIIRDEYFHGAVSRRLSVRRCLLSYVIQDLRLAVDLKRETPPEFQLAIINAELLQPYFFSSTA